MKKFLKKIFLKASKLLKLGLVDETSLLLTVDSKLSKLKPSTLIFSYKLPIYAKDQQSKKFEDFVRQKLANEFYDEIKPFIKITVFENTAFEELIIEGELNILEHVEKYRLISR